VISHRYRCVYVHIPKTGGTSVENALRNRVLVRNGGSEHVTLSEYEGAMEPIRYREYLKFSVVRNPWDRVLSTFAWLSQGGNGSAGANRKAQEVGRDFTAFCRRVLRDGEYSELLAPNVLGQAEWLKDSSGTLGVDFIAKLETIAEDYARLREVLGLRKRTLPHTRRSQHGGAPEIYTRETAEIVLQRYRPDVEAFDYDLPDWWRWS
jgi:hypothetical protein